MMPIVPIFGTAAVFSSTFFALRGMANLPVESFKTGGILWFSNLTIVDPFYLLPVLTATSLFINIKVGGDGADQMPPVMKKILLILPIISFPVMCQFPLALNVYWFTNNLFITQQRLLSSKLGKNVFGFEEARTDISMQDPLERIRTREKLLALKKKQKK